MPEYFVRSDRFANPVDDLGLIARQPLACNPDKQWNYSNAGFMLSGRIIDNVSGESCFDYAQRRVFKPAQMASSGFASVDEIVPRLAVGSYQDDGLFSRR